MEILQAQVIGEGKPFLILHGFLGMSDNWRTLGRRFAEEDYEVHLIDLRNHGRSFHSEAFTYALMVEDVKEYIQSKDLESVILLGHSMGGKVAMQFATTYPEYIDKLIVGDIAPKAYPQHHQIILKGLSSLHFANPETGEEGISSRGEADEALSEYIKSATLRQFLLKNLYWESKGKLGLRINLPVLVETIEEIGKALEQDAIFKGDTLFIYGGNSDYIIPGDQILLKHHFPNCQLKKIEGAGHWLHAEKPQEFFESIMSFLN